MLVRGIEDFLLELGRGFMFVGTQQRVTLNNTHYYVDMVFYNKILKAYVLIELKRTKLTPEAAGQLNMYLNYYATEVNDEVDNPPIGIILCEFMGTTFNFAKMDDVKLDKALKTVLFNVEFPDANTIKYSCYYNNQSMSMEAPIVVDGNKMTVKMSEKNPAYKDTDLYTFQDQDNTQMHMYMPTYAFENFFGNMQVTIMEQLGMLDTTDAAAVQAVFQSIYDAVETINVSFVMTRAK